MNKIYQELKQACSSNDIPAMITLIANIKVIDFKDDAMFMDLYRQAVNKISE